MGGPRPASQPRAGLSGAAQAIVVGSVLAVVLLGGVALTQRQQAIDLVAEASSQPVAVAGAEASAQPTATPTPVLPPDAGGPDTYTVQPGDSLFSVANALELSPNELVYWNKDTYPTLQSTPALKAGWVLRTTGPPLPTRPPRATPTPRPTPQPQVAAPEIPGLPAFGPEHFPASHAVTVTYYAVTGLTPRQIYASMDQNGPWSEWAGENAQAQVEVLPSFNFSFQGDGRGGCSVVIAGAVPVTMSYHVVLPAWAPPPNVAPSVIDWWADVITDTVHHEAHHITLYESHLPAINEAVRTGTCDSVEQDLERIWTDARRANCEFDLVEYGYAAGLTLESCLES